MVGTEQANQFRDMLCMLLLLSCARHTSRFACADSVTHIKSRFSRVTIISNIKQYAGIDSRCVRQRQQTVSTPATEDCAPKQTQHSCSVRPLFQEADFWLPVGLVLSSCPAVVLLLQPAEFQRCESVPGASFWCRELI